MDYSCFRCVFWFMWYGCFMIIKIVYCEWIGQ